MKRLLIFLAVLFAFCFGGAISATAQQKQLDPNKIFGIMGDKYIPEMNGLSCGIPGTKQNRCCNVGKSKKDVKEIQERMFDRVPEFFCLPPGLTQVAQAGGGILGDITDVFTEPIEAAVNLAQGDLGGAVDSLGDAVLPDGIVNGAKDIINGEKVCLSDAPKLVIATTIGILPLNRASNLDLPPQPCIEGAVPTKKDFSDKACKCVPDPTGIGAICKQYLRDPKELPSCLTCVSKRGVWTGLGCIGTDLPGFTASVMRIGVGVAGGFAMLCILYAALLFQTSRGNPERLKKAREYMTSCIIGLLLILFSVFILRIVGVNILAIPGFQ